MKLKSKGVGGVRRDRFEGYLCPVACLLGMEKRYCACSRDWPG